MTNVSCRRRRTRRPVWAVPSGAAIRANTRRNVAELSRWTPYSCRVRRRSGARVASGARATSAAAGSAVPARLALRLRRRRRSRAAGVPSGACGALRRPRCTKLAGDTHGRGAICRPDAARESRRTHTTAACGGQARRRAVSTRWTWSALPCTRQAVLAGRTSSRDRRCRSRDTVVARRAVAAALAGGQPRRTAVRSRCALPSASRQRHRSTRSVGALCAVHASACAAKAVPTRWTRVTERIG